MSSRDPFVAGQTYRVLRTVVDHFSNVREGQRLRYVGYGFGIYDEIHCFSFFGEDGERYYWCVQGELPPTSWCETFEVVSSHAA